MKSTNIILIILTIIIGIGLSLSFKVNSGENSEEDRIYLKESNKVFSVPIPDKVTFIDENVPIDRFYVKEALEKEITVNTYFHSSSIFLIKKANRWFPVIEPILKKYNIPADFKYLAVAESGLENAVSPVGATGFWQLMPNTARELGLEVNADIDQRYDVELSTEAACKYLNKAFEKYGNWTLVAASYNAGMAKISEEIQRQQHSNYYDMIFVEETSRYVYRIIAIKNLLENPSDYGFFIRSKDLFQPFNLKKIAIDSTISNIPAFAKSYNLSYKEFKIYNPWIRQAYLANKSGRTYLVQVPKS